MAYRLFSRGISSYKIALKFNGNDANCLALTKFETPTLGKRDVLLKLQAAAINPADFNFMEGKYPVYTPPFPCSIGFEGCFRVADVGSEVANVIKNDLVLVMPRREKEYDSSLPENFGHWTLHRVVSDNYLHKLPNELPDAIAATIRVNPVTALALLNKFVKLEKGEYVIFDGASSHLGQSLIQVSRIKGLNPICVITDAPYANQVKDNLRSLGADEIYTLEELKSAIKSNKFSSSRPRFGVDMIGGEYTSGILKVIADEGTLVSVGNMKRDLPKISPGELIFRNKIVTGFNSTKWCHLYKEEFFKCIEELSNYALQGKLREPQNIERFAMEDYAKIFDKRDPSKPSTRRMFTH